MEDKKKKKKRRMCKYQLAIYTTPAHLKTQYRIR